MATPDSYDLVRAVRNGSLTSESILSYQGFISINFEKRVSRFATGAIWPFFCQRDG